MHLLLPSYVVIIYEYIQHVKTGKSNLSKRNIILLLIFI